MIKATKATTKRLKAMSDKPLARILSEAIEHADNLQSFIDDGFGDRITDRGNEYYTPDCLYILCDAWAKPYFAGFKTRFYDLIDTTFTAGNNEVRIPDVNKMVKAMMTY